MAGCQSNTQREEMVMSDPMPSFKERKTSQLVGLLTRQSGGEIDLYKLLKMVYIIDRTALERWGRPVTFDRHCSLPLGPTPEGLYDLIRGNVYGETWSRHFSERLPGHRIRLIGRDLGEDELSTAEAELAMEIFERIQPMSFDEIKDLVHGFPEYTDPDGSSSRIPIEKMLSAVGWEGDDVKEIMSELQSMAYIENVSQ